MLFKLISLLLLGGKKAATSTQGRRISPSYRPSCLEMDMEIQKVEGCDETIL